MIGSCRSGVMICALDGVPGNFSLGIVRRKEPCTVVGREFSSGHVAQADTSDVNRIPQYALKARLQPGFAVDGVTKLVQANGDPATVMDSSANTLKAYRTTSTRWGASLLGM